MVVKPKSATGGKGYICENVIFRYGNKPVLNILRMANIQLSTTFAASSNAPQARPSKSDLVISLILYFLSALQLLLTSDIIITDYHGIYNNYIELIVKK